MPDMQAMTMVAAEVMYIAFVYGCFLNHCANLLRISFMSSSPTPSMNRAVKAVRGLHDVVFHAVVGHPS
jgi:hypothetical protein